MIVVSDTSVVTALLQLGEIELLRDLYGDVAIPEAVSRELLRAHETLPSFLLVCQAKDRELVSMLERLLDEGESEAIALSVELKADALLMDETKGREIARSKGLHVVGLLGVLVQARRKGRIPALALLMKRLREDVGFYVSEELEREILELVGEV